jgi:hypothetical protein
MDTIKGLALVATFIGFLAIFAMWVSLSLASLMTSWLRSRDEDFPHHGPLRRYRAA